MPSYLRPGAKDEFLALLQNFKTGAQRGQLEKMIANDGFTVYEFSKALRKGKDDLIDNVQDIVY